MLHSNTLQSRAVDISHATRTGDLFRLARTRAGLSIRAAAKDAGVTVGALRQMEGRPGNAATSDAARALAGLYRIAWEDVLVTCGALSEPAGWLPDMIAAKLLPDMPL